MLVQTHRLIGEMVYTTVAEKMGLRLSKEAFKYGCIKPDIVPKYRAIRHYKKESFDFVNQMIEEISGELMPMSRKGLKRYSVKLGMIIHYITDYFCSAHNYLKYESIVDHVIYERRLAKKFSQINFDKTRADLWSRISIYNLDSSLSLINYIEDRHNEYLKGSNGVINDIYVSVELCLIVSSFIISNCLRNTYKKAA